MNLRITMIGILIMMQSPVIVGADRLSDDDEEEEIAQAVDTAMVLPGGIFDRIRAAFARLGEAFDHLWFTCTGRRLNIPKAEPRTPAAHRQEEEGKQAPARQDSGIGPVDDLAEMASAIHEIYDISREATHTLVDKLTELERETLQTLHHATHKSLQADLLAGGGGMAIMYWIFKNQPLIILRKAAEKRFVALGTVAAVKTTAALLVPLLKPVGVLVGGAVVWYKFKQWIIAPYKLKYQAEIEKFKLELKNHRQEVQRDLQKHVDDTHQFTVRVDSALALIKHEFQDELRTVHTESAELQARISEDQKHLRQQVTTITQEVRSQLTDIGKDVGDAKANNEEMRKKLREALPILLETQQLLKRMKEQKERELARAGGSIEAPPKKKSIFG